MIEKFIFILLIALFLFLLFLYLRKNEIENYSSIFEAEKLITLVKK